MKKQYVNSFSQNGEKVDDKFAVEFKKPPTEYKGRDKPGKWFELMLSDRTGELSAKFWGKDAEKTDMLYMTISKGDVVHIKGKIQEYPPGSGNFSISIDALEGSLRKCDPGEYDLDDFVARSEKDINAMVEEMENLLRSVKNEHLKELIRAFLQDGEFMQAFKKSPCSMHYHQNRIGGLAEHTLNAMKIANNLCDIHPELDRDLMLAGAFLHDLGKIEEFEVTGGVIDVSAEGMLMGHIISGHSMVSKRIERLKDFPKDLEQKILHTIISHHGKPEEGASKQPQLPEAVAIHCADESDAKIDLFLRLKREANTEDPWIWSKKIKGHVYLK